MEDEFTLSYTTNIAKLLQRFDYAGDVLGAISSKFTMLTNPVMRATLAHTVDIQKASRMGDVSADVMIDKLAMEIQQRNPNVKLNIRKGVTLDMSDEAAPGPSMNKKLDIMESIVLDLHSGGDVHELQERFRNLVHGVDAVEIAAMEQQLINSGRLTPEQITSMCDLHVQLFKVMWSVHDDVRAMFKNILEGSMAPTPQQCAPLLHILEDLVYKEQSILFPMASQVLFDADWDTVARGEEEIGYCFIDHIDRPMTAADVHTVVSEYSAPSNKIPLSTGALTAEQIDGIFKVLPMDISFVDIDERVAYYSADRIFPRSPNVIGRKVQHCHPQKSLAQVQDILNAFKSGARDSAEFYIQMGDKFVLIQYFAVKDSKGAYLGCLEDIKHHREIRGQKRLLDWE